jgi:AraC-like DNA-binding protein
MSAPLRRRGRGGQGGHEPRARIRTRAIRAVELSVRGWSQHRIAADLGISQAAVSKLLARVEGRELRDLVETLDRHRARQTLRLEHQYAEAMAAWEASKADTTRKRQRKSQGGGAGAGATVSELVVENQNGDPRYLETARKAMADLWKIWGLEAPKAIDVRTPDPYAGMTEEALLEELARYSRLLGAPMSAVPDATNPDSSVDAQSQEVDDAEPA